MAEVYVVQSGNLIALGSGPGKPLAPELRRLIEPRLVYTHQKMLYGKDRRDPVTGVYRKMLFTDRKLYTVDALGRLVCSARLLVDIKKDFEENGDTLRLEVKHPTGSPPFTRPNRFKTNWDGLVDAIEFRPRQDDAVVALASSECGVIQAPPAFGKTWLILSLCLLYPNARIDIVIKRKDIVVKTVLFLKKFLSGVGQVGGGKKDFHRVTVYTADSLHLADGSADIVIGDEAHELLAESYSKEFAKYRYARVFGLTATPEGRKDGTDVRMASVFGPTIFSITFQECVALGLVTPIRVEWLNVELSANPCKDKQDVAKKRWGLWRNDERNQIIADRVRQLGDEQVLILVETIEHALFLRQRLPEYAVVYSDNGMTPEDLEMYRRWGLMGFDELPIDAKKREDMRRRFESGELRKVIATSVWNTGVDFVNLQVVVRADGNDSEILDFQAPGRVCRVAEGKTVGIVIDCMDQFDDGLRNKARKRLRNYTAKGWENVQPSKRAFSRS